MSRSENVERLHTVLMHYAPNAEAQRRLTAQRQSWEAAIEQEAESERQAENQLVLCMAGAIFDGLAYGNWPWGATHSTSRTGATR